jgi:hypothetical protein
MKTDEKCLGEVCFEARYARMGYRGTIWKDLDAGTRADFERAAQAVAEFLKSEFETEKR